MTNKEFVTLEELCHILSIGKSKAYELVRMNKLTSCKIGGKWMIHYDSINEYVTSEIDRQSRDKAITV